MKAYNYLFAASMLLISCDTILTSAKLYACPRCRRAEPKGPRKLPHPDYPGKSNRVQQPVIRSGNHA